MFSCSRYASIIDHECLKAEIILCPATMDLFSTPWNFFPTKFLKKFASKNWPFHVSSWGKAVFESCGYICGYFWQCEFVKIFTIVYLCSLKKNFERGANLGHSRAVYLEKSFQGQLNLKAFIEDHCFGPVNSIFSLLFVLNYLYFYHSCQ